MIKGRRYFRGFSKMNKSELKHQKELWKEEKERKFPGSSDIASTKLLVINILIFLKVFNENLGKIISAFLLILLVITLLIG